MKSKFRRGDIIQYKGELSESKVDIVLGTRLLKGLEKRKVTIEKVYNLWNIKHKCYGELYVSEIDYMFRKIGFVNLVRNRKILV
jgi:hypothetical protein